METVEQIIRRGLGLLFPMDEVVELRVLDLRQGSRLVTGSGYYDDMDRLAHDAAALDGQAMGMYVTLNRVNPALLARRQNKLATSGRLETTADQDILERLWLPLDIDPIRPAGISSTEEEHAASLKRARDIMAWLSELGWPSPMLINSGNGHQLLYRLNMLTNKQEWADVNRTLVEGVLKTISLIYSDDTVKVDTGVANASRIWKLPGTMACKGENTPERPHRRAVILEAPEKFQAVSFDLLNNLTKLGREIDPPRDWSSAKKIEETRGSKVKVQDLLDKMGCRVVSERRGRLGTMAKLDVCPWNHSHTRSAWLLWDDDGYAIAAGCPHNSCQANENRVRDLIDQYMPRPNMEGKTREPSTIEAPSSDEVKSYKRTDLGNAERLVHQYRDKIRYCHLWNKWLVWDDRRWRVDDSGMIQRLAKQTIRNIYREAADQDEPGERKSTFKWAIKSESDRSIKAMISLAKNEQGIPVTPEELDSNPWLLNVLNGTLDLSTGELRPHNPSDMLTKLIQVEYDDAAECPQVLEFLDRIMDRDRDRIAFLQRAMGYSLTGDIGEQCMFILYGSGANGKSTFLAIIRHLLGEYSMHTPSETLLAKRHEGGVPNDVARLKGARLVTSVESDEGRRLAESLIKQMTGGDPVAARFMRGEWFEFVPQFKIFLATNHQPEIRGTDLAIRRRIHLIPFDVTIPEEERDPRLLDKLKEELPGILKWCAEGCRNWREHGLQPPSSVVMATKSYIDDQDIVGRFLDERCILDEGSRIKSRELYMAYKLWCAETNERHVVSEKQFSTRIAEKGFSKQKSGHIYWIGIHLAPPDIGAEGGREGAPVSPIIDENYSPAHNDKTLQSSLNNPVPPEKPGQMPPVSQDERMRGLYDIIQDLSRKSVKTGGPDGAFEQGIVEYMMTYNDPPERTRELLAKLVTEGRLSHPPNFPYYYQVVIT